MALGVASITFCSRLLNKNENENNCFQREVRNFFFFLKHGHTFPLLSKNTCTLTHLIL